MLCSCFSIVASAKNSNTLFMLLLYVYHRKLKIVAPCSCTRKGLAVKVGKLYTCLLRIIDNHFLNGDSITPHFLGQFSNNIVTTSSLLPGTGSSQITLRITSILVICMADENTLLFFWYKHLRSLWRYTRLCKNNPTPKLDIWLSGSISITWWIKKLFTLARD